MAMVGSSDGSKANRRDASGKELVEPEPAGSELRRGIRPRKMRYLRENEWCVARDNLQRSPLIRAVRCGAGSQLSSDLQSRSQRFPEEAETRRASHDDEPRRAVCQHLTQNRARQLGE